jgi:hypothetical protein
MAGGVFVLGVCEGPDERPVTAPTGEEWQMFTDEHARSRAFDGLELAANVLGRIGLGVEAIDLGKSAGEKDEDDGARRRGGGRQWTGSGRGSECSQLGETEAKETHRACFERTPAGQPRVMIGRTRWKKPIRHS